MHAFIQTWSASVEPWRATNMFKGGQLTNICSNNFRFSVKNNPSPCLDGASRGNQVTIVEVSNAVPSSEDLFSSKRQFSSKL